MPEALHPRGLIDTSVVIDLGVIEPARLPAEMAISAVTIAELSAGPYATGDATGDPAERARLQDRLQRAGATWD